MVSLYYLGKYLGQSIRALQDERGGMSDAAAANRARLIAQLVSRGKTPEEARRIAAAAPNKHEAAILAEVVFPDQLASSFAEVGGLEKMKEELYESIILPLREPQLFRQMHEASSLLSIPGGVLLYGPPGTGACGGQSNHGTGKRIAARVRVPGFAHATVSRSSRVELCCHAVPMRC